MTVQAKTTKFYFLYTNKHISTVTYVRTHINLCTNMDRTRHRTFDMMWNKISWGFSHRYKDFR